MVKKGQGQGLGGDSNKGFIYSRQNDRSPAERGEGKERKKKKAKEEEIITKKPAVEINSYPTQDNRKPIEKG